MKTHSLVIGGTRGIGRALVKKWSDLGHKVSVIGRREPQPEDKDLANVNHWIVDITQTNKLIDCLRKIVMENGKIKNIVFFQRFRGEGDAWVGEYETSLMATKNIIEYLKVKFSRALNGSIVLVGSKAGQLIANEQPVSYHVAKAGVAQMARYYAVELGPRNIRVNCVSMGVVIKKESAGFYKKNVKLSNTYKSITPLGRLGTTEDISSAIDFLCSENASFITGQNIIIDGGASLIAQETLARETSSLRSLKVTR